MIRVFFIVSVVFVVATGCDQSAGTGTCDLDGRTFSAAQRECGLCACGEVSTCNWLVEFGDGEMSRNFDDTGSTSAYVCTENELRSPITGDLLGTYDPVADELTVDGIEYGACDGCAIDEVPCDDVCPHACDDLFGRGFRAGKYECGICSEEEVRCYWIVEFGADYSYHYSYSDVASSGRWTCANDGTITAQPEVWTSSYDATTGVLLWDGLEFYACEGECDPEYEGCGWPPSP